MNEIKLLFTAVTATLILEFAYAFIAFFQPKKTIKPRLSIQFLNAFSIENYTFCEKALCKMVQVTIALSFISVYEITTFESAAETNFYSAVLFGIGGILMVKFLFSALLKVSNYKIFYKQIYYSHAIVFAAIAARAYQSYS